MRRAQRLVAAAGVAALVAVATWYTLLRPDPVLSLTAEFPHAEGIYAGNKVAILGVTVGTVRSVEPRGGIVRIGMDLPADTKVPADAHAYIMSPSVISDRFVELGPAYTGGATLDSGAVIPAERSHSPVKWDELSSTMDTLLTAFGPSGLNNGGDLGGSLSLAASMLGGQGPAIKEALTGISQASGLLAGNSGDLGVLLDNLNKLVNLLTEHKSTTDSLVALLTQAGRDFSAEQLDIAGTVTQLAEALRQLDTLIREHGTDLTGSVTNLANLTTMVSAHQQNLIDIMDVAPLAFQNLGRAVTEDERMRIRLNVSTALEQLPLTAELCKKFPVPLCSGPGLVNPIPLPPELLNPLLQALYPNGTTGALPNEANPSGGGR
jgi:phospholipid/cholesterol/gamma-HCH transport system substrate-binding protein